ncbi:MAG: STAS domain-containing protein [Syntrophobacteraceae bacterium]
MTVEVVEKAPRTFIIRTEGDVDLSTSPRLRDAVLSVFEQETGHVVVDLSAVPYMDSSGIATLVEALRLSRQSNARLTLAAMRPAVESVFELAYLKQVFEVAVSVEEALGGGTPA